MSVGYVLTHQFVLDAETGESIQFTYNAAEGASALDLAHAMHTAAVAAWSRILAANTRRLERVQLVRAERDRRLQEARKGGLTTRVSEKDLAREDAELRTGQLRLEADVAADTIILDRERQLSDADLAARVARAEQANGAVQEA